MQVARTFTTKYQDYFMFLNVAQNILPSFEGNKNKLTYAIERVIKLNSNVQKNYQDLLEDLKIDNANVDEKGSLITTVNAKTGAAEYQYTKEGAKALKKAVKELAESEVEISVFYAAELPESYDKIFNSYLIGFVLDPNTHSAEYEFEEVPPVEA